MPEVPEGGYVEGVMEMEVETQQSMVDRRQTEMPTMPEANSHG